MGHQVTYCTQKPTDSVKLEYDNNPITTCYSYLTRKGINLSIIQLHCQQINVKISKKIICIATNFISFVKILPTVYCKDETFNGKMQMILQMEQTGRVSSKM